MSARSSSRGDAALRVLAAIFGTLPVALLSGACLARFLPLSADARFAIALSTAIPLWVCAMCAGFLVRSGVRVLLLCVAASTLLAGLSFGVPH